MAMNETELRCLLAVSRRLPRLRGCGRIGLLLSRFFSRKVRDDVVADVLGCQMRLNPRECVEGQLLFCPQHYERAELAELRKRIQPGDTFLDAGANIGFYSLLLSRVVADHGRVIAVEADPRNFQRLQDNIALNRLRNITARHIGLSDSTATLRLGLNLSGNRSGHSFLIVGDAGVEVECLPLLQVLVEEGVDRVDAAKFDIEGFEFKVLKPFLEAAPARLIPRTIVIEQNPRFSAGAGGDALALLRHHGFAVGKLKEHDYLAVRD